MWEEEIMDKDRIVVIAVEGLAPQLWNLEVYFAGAEDAG